jgi:hypothetical protein
MKPRRPDLEWMRKLLADLERDRLDPAIAAALDSAALCPQPAPKLAPTAPEKPRFSSSE